MKQSKENNKESAKERRAKGAAATRGMNQKSSGKARAVKVVDVELKGRKKTQKKLVATAKKGAASSRQSASRPNRQSSASAAAKSSSAAKSATAKTAAVRAKTAKAALPAEPDLVVIEVPTEKLLRPFRRMAEQNRLQAKAVKKADRVARGSFLAKPAKKGRRYYADLRVHTPGTLGYFANGGIDPGPALVRLASVKGLHMIGLADYYNFSYLDQVRGSATSSELVVLPGVILCCEVCGCREVFLLVLFPETAGSTEIAALLDDLAVPKSVYGRRDFCLPQEIGEILEAVERHGAIAIPSRVDKTPYRQLAIAELVEKYGLHAFDLAHPDSPELFRERWPSGGPNGGFTFFSFSSANALGQIGNRVGRITMPHPNFAGLREIVSRRPPFASVLTTPELVDPIEANGLALRNTVQDEQLPSGS